MKVLFVAVERARVILATVGAANNDSPYMRYLLARAVLRAAERGECSVARLSEAACEHAHAEIGAASYAFH